MNQASSAQPVASHGRVTAAFGRHYEVMPFSADTTSNGTNETDWATPRLKCYPRGKKSRFACGDEVEIDATGSGQGVITRLVPRSSLLWRSDAFREKLIASNLSQIVIVVATEPGFSDLLISRCIAAAESQNLQSLIVLNKADLSDKLAQAQKRLEVFSSLGYEVVECSALAHADALKPRLSNARSIFVGQSGMGKSTLTNMLIPEAEASTREISEALDTGKHTTTFARLYPFGAHGWLIDSPGLQAFGLAHLDADTLPEHFVEFRPHIGNCRFRDCKHETEPGCALTEAVASGAISAQRFEHFRLIREEIRAAHKQSRGW